MATFLQAFINNSLLALSLAVAIGMVFVLYKIKDWLKYGLKGWEFHGDRRFKVSIDKGIAHRDIHNIVVEKDGVKTRYAQSEDIPDPKIRGLIEQTKEGMLPAGARVLQKTTQTKIIYKGKEYASIDQIPDPRIREIMKSKLTPIKK